MEPFNPACTNESARTEDPPCGLTQHVCLAAAGSALECCKAKHLVLNKHYVLQMLVVKSTLSQILTGNTKCLEREISVDGLKSPACCSHAKLW